MKIARGLKDVGESLGLKCLGLEDRSKHYKLMFQRPDGATYGVTLHKSKNELPRRHVLNMEKALKNFAGGKEMFGNG